MHANSLAHSSLNPVFPNTFKNISGPVETHISYSNVCLAWRNVWYIRFLTGWLPSEDEINKFYLKGKGVLCFSPTNQERESHVTLVNMKWVMNIHIYNKLSVKVRSTVVSSWLEFWHNAKLRMKLIMVNDTCQWGPLNWSCKSNMAAWPVPGHEAPLPNKCLTKFVLKGWHFLGMTNICSLYHVSGNLKLTKIGLCAWPLMG